MIQGGEETLKMTSMIWIETSFKPLYENSSVFSQIYDLLNEKGFILMEISPGFRSPNGELLQVDLLFIKNKAQ